MSVTPESMIIGRKPGRPRSMERKASVSAWIPERDLDRLITIANNHGVSVSKFVSHLLTKEINR